MPSLRSVLLLGLPLSAIALPEGQRVEDPQIDATTVAEWEEILKELPGESLKAAVEGNLKPKYRDGVFEDGHDAIDAVRNDDPELASRLVDLAKQDAMVKEYLRKRQSSNSTSSESIVTTSSPIVVISSTTTAVTVTTDTTTVSVDTTTSSTQQTTPSSTEETSVGTPTTNSQGQSTTAVVPVSSTVTGGDSSTQTGVLVPIQVTSTRDGTTMVQTTNAFETGDAPTSVMVGITTTNDQGETVTTSTMAPAVAVTSTNEQGSVVTTASPLQSVAVAPGGSVVSSAAGMVTTTDGQGDMVVLSSPSPGGVYTVTDARGHIATVTYQPSGGVVSQLRLQTTVLPNGQRSTITSFAEVGATGDVTPPPSGGPASSSATASLQSGAAVLHSYYAAELALILGAAFGIGALLL